MTSPITPNLTGLNRAVAEFAREDVQPQKGNDVSSPNAGAVKSRGPEVSDLLTTGAPTGFATLSEVLDSVSNTIGLLKAGLSGLNAMTETASEVGAQMIVARDDGSPGLIDQALSRFRELPGNLSSIALTAEFSSRNVLGEAGHSETVEISTLSVSISFVDYTGGRALDLGDAEERAPEAALEFALEQINGFMERASAHRGSLAAALDEVKSDGGVPSLMDAMFPDAVEEVADEDRIEEAIRLLALQTRQGLAGTSESLTPESRLNALRFFG